MSNENHPEQAPPSEASRRRLIETAGMSEEELAEAKRYGRQSLACTLTDKAVDVAYLAVVALLLARPVDAWLGRWNLLAGNDSLRLIALFLVVTAVHMGVSLPIAFYSGYVLEHRFGLSRQSAAAWFWRYAKRNLLSAAFGVAMFLGLYWLIWTTGPAWWLVAAGAFFLVSILMGQLLPVVILPLFYRIKRLELPELADRVGRLTEGTALSIEGVYRIDIGEETAKANAMLTGLGRTRRVLLGDTLLEKFSPGEIEVIFAHEIGHHVFGHLPKMLAIGILYSVAGFWISDRLLTASVPGWQGNYADLPVYTLPLLMLILSLFTLVLQPLQNILSRRFERQCDRYALERTRRPEEYISAFCKLARLNKEDPEPHALDVVLLHSHPPIGQRLAMAEAFQ